ncbi:MAG: hypothetical protein CVU06_09070 [Bacteroidetes bacterium HGW-Bacteroidetes-22]|nr:MAG: hypothetical protein CVU06_09070 [Bacteroidetes bacterium HGW-Bacteroidetes-22]
MKPFWFKTIVWIAAVSLAGIIFTQVYWVRNAWLLKEEQFDSRVKVALKTVVNRLYKQIASPAKVVLIAGCPPSCAIPDSVKSGLSIDGYLLDSLLVDEFKGTDINRGFYYAVYSTLDKKSLLGNPDRYFSNIYFNCQIQSTVFW